MSKWKRYRFTSTEEDYRPIKFPPPGPWWCSGEGDGYSVLIAYLPFEAELTEYWPEAEDTEYEERDELTFTDRFPKPHWWIEP